MHTRLYHNLIARRCDSLDNEMELIIWIYFKRYFSLGFPWTMIKNLQCKQQVA